MHYDGGAQNTGDAGGKGGGGDLQCPSRPTRAHLEALPPNSGRLASFGRPAAPGIEDAAPQGAGPNVGECPRKALDCTSPKARNFGPWPPL